MFLHDRALKNHFEHKVIISQFISSSNISKLHLPNKCSLLIWSIFSISVCCIVKQQFQIEYCFEMWKLSNSYLKTDGFIEGFLCIYFYFLGTFCKNLQRSRSVNLPASPEILTICIYFTECNSWGTQRIHPKITSKGS